jgi:oligoendopeptidase F
MKTHLAALLSALAATTALAQTERPQDKWNLADLYPSAEAWEAEAAKLEAQLPQVTACKGHLGDSAKKMLECLTLRSDATKRYYRMVVFAYEQFAQDTGVPASIAMRQRRRSSARRRPRPRRSSIPRSSRSAARRSSSS